MSDSYVISYVHETRNRATGQIERQRHVLRPIGSTKEARTTEANLKLNDKVSDIVVEVVG